MSGKIVPFQKKYKACDDTCDHCIYIGEGDFICDIQQEIVISEWFPLYVECTLNKS